LTLLDAATILLGMFPPSSTGAAASVAPPSSRSRTPQFSRTLVRRSPGAGPLTRVFLLFAVLAVGLLQPSPAAAQQKDPACDSSNLTRNCEFDSYGGSPPRQLPDGWSPFVLSGDVDFRSEIPPPDYTHVPSPPGLRLSSAGTFVAGIYQQVPVQPGVAYKAGLGWGAPLQPETFGRQLGIDPTGGTDPAAPTVVWGPEHWGAGRVLNYTSPDAGHASISVSAVAQAPTLTVFVKVNHNPAVPNGWIELDAVSLHVDPNYPTPVPATATPVPPTPAPRPTAVPRTATPRPSPTPTATYTLTPTETPTPTSTFTPSATPTFTPTYTPSLTPTWTLPPRPKATRAPEEATPQPVSAGFTRAGFAEPAPRGLFWAGLSALGLAGALSVGVILVRRR
jgi:hypothetical protein